MSEANTPPPIAYQAQPMSDVDVTHLNVLAICFWVWGALTAVFSSFALIHLAMGIAIVTGNFNMQAQPPGSEKFIGWMFILVGGLIVGLGWLIGALSIYAGFCLKRQRRWMFCMVVASLNCLSIPIGTTLGVFSIIVLVRPRVKAMFASSAPYAVR